ncbi:MAG TPA: DEAD/DEAH box helicase family protein [Bacteroidia bacterium]|jgi:type III restriction enzyme|nr:DEAD/DEAH box helicase family protein [Bacteroidia bacterium]
MKLKFDSNQEFQLEAIKSITDIFEGQTLKNSDFEFSITQPGELMTESGFGNKLDFSRLDQLVPNIQRIQQVNGIKLQGKEEIIANGWNFSVEMETGTGKTYVYLRTIYELNKLYGFKKFVIVVPSVAIREGVLKNLEITEEHLQSLYEKVPADSYVYDSRKVSNLRGFASSNTIQIIVINIDSFAKDENIINKPNDKLTGRKPVEFIQGCKPIVIVDEPQNMETEIRRRAIENLNPLCTLRYSATHTNFYNLVYSLNPVKAYDLGLVKQIEVDSVVSENDFNSPFLQLENITRVGNNIKARIKIDVITEKGIKRKSVTAGVKNDNLYFLSDENSKYDGLKIIEFDLAEEQIELSNGLVLKKGETQGGMNDEVMKVMIRKTIEEHLRKERNYNDKGIKVLSLFFIDKVKNYREYDQSGNPLKGKFAKWFEELYEEEISNPINKTISSHSAQDVHNGYFSQDNKGRVKDTGGETQLDDQTYRLIMKSKEELLDLNTPLRFIFSHSALREGWDNPNVFQICTLNETKSEVKKRQEIGRGLRLSVNGQSGERIFDRNINRLTVIANESYDDFANALQKEIEEDCGVDFSGRIKNRNERKKVNYRKGFEADPKFLQIWEKIKFQTKYSVDYNTSELVSQASDAIRKMEETRKPAVRSTRQKVLITEEGVDGMLISDSFDENYLASFEIPDMLSYIQGKTELTRKTILDIIKKSGRLEELLLNPQMFMDNAVARIKEELNMLMIKGIKYEKIGGRVYEMTLFNDTDFEIFLDDFTYTVNNSAKTIYDNYIPLDSGVETQFARDCESSEQVEFYFKLPTWFEITTPIGKYRPDWAVVFNNEKRIYFVAETKSAGQELRESEKLKIECGKAHFENFNDVVYKRVSTVKDLSN